MKRNIFIVWMTACCLSLQAQEAWTLQQCIEYAIGHNLNIKQQEAAQEQSKVELNTAQWRRLPNLNGNIGQSFNFGRALPTSAVYSFGNALISFYKSLFLFVGKKKSII